MSVQNAKGVVKKKKDGRRRHEKEEGSGKNSINPKKLKFLTD